MKRPDVAVSGVVLLFIVLGTVTAIATPAWENADEPGHVQNIETLTRGDWYRMRTGSGDEAHQPPLYYLTLAGWQTVTRQPTSVVAPQRGRAVIGTVPTFGHDEPAESRDHRLLLWLRIPNVLLGAVVVLLAAAAARRLSTDPWTPVVAAAVVATVPRFVFLSAGVTNDNLATTLGAALTLLTVIYLHRKIRWFAAAIGATIGALILTKLSAATLTIAAVTAIVVAVRARERLLQLLIALGAAFAVCGWWLIDNWIRYSDPFATKASRDYLRPIGGLGASVVNGRLVLGTGDRNLFGLVLREVPGRVWVSFWYQSGWNSFRWSTWTYLPFWIALAIAIGGFAFYHVDRRVLVVLGAISVAAFASIWLVALQTTTYQARLAFPGLAALAVLAALGLERWRLPIRFLLPAMGLAGTLAAIQRDVLSVHWT
jgi:4-amino-4-deoxy-L-arabinose transferase-like glycosyltransferase